jgi:hypothetical protein
MAMTKTLDQIEQLIATLRAQCESASDQTRAAEQRATDLAVRLDRATNLLVENRVEQYPYDTANTRSMLAVQAAVVLIQGTDEDKASYLRMRGWTMNGTGWYSNAALGYETILPQRAVELQVKADAAPFAFLLDSLRPRLVIS